MGLWKLLLGRRDIITVASKRDAPTDQDFRYENDPLHVVRLNPPWPDGISAYVESDVPVAGISQRGAKKDAISCIRGSSRSVQLRREQDNRHDPNAIAVIAQWTDNSGWRREGRVGWVPAELAESYPSEQLGARLRTLFRARRGMSPGMRIDIGRPRCKASEESAPESSVSGARSRRREWCSRQFEKLTLSCNR